MEHSTSAVNWQPRNAAKRPGEMIRNSLSHVARGSQGAMFFQWRASRAGAEKWHSAMVPHAGTDCRCGATWCALGGHLAGWPPVLRLDRLRPGRAAARLPEHLGEAHPAAAQRRHGAEAELKRWHAALLRLGITADLAHPGATSDRYRARLRAEPLPGQRRRRRQPRAYVDERRHRAGRPVQR